MIDHCAICKGKFAEKDLELSHDIPKYLGGNDLNGRHYLCEECHDKYERMILARCYAELKMLLPKPFSRKSLIPHMCNLKNSSESQKETFRKIAEQTKKEVFEDGKGI